MFQFIGLRIRIKYESNESSCFSPVIENLICFKRERIFFLIGIRYDTFSYHEGIFINFKNERDIEMECLYVYMILMEENVVRYRIYYISKKTHVSNYKRVKISSMIKVYIFNIDKTINLIYYSYNQEYIFTICLFKQITCEINKLLNKKISQDSKM